MGVTLFDLFGEIVTEADLKLFLRFGSILSQVRVSLFDRPCPRSDGQSNQKSKNGIFEDFTTGACIIRSFLLLLELNRFEISQNSEVAVNNSDFIGRNIGENIGGEIKEEYQGPTEDSNVSVCLEEDSYDPLEAVPEDIPPGDPKTSEIPIEEPIIEEIDPQEDIPIGLLTKPTRRSARVRVKCAKRRIENVFDSEDSEDDDSGWLYFRWLIPI